MKDIIIPVLLILILGMLVYVACQNPDNKMIAPQKISLQKQIIKIQVQTVYGFKCFDANNNILVCKNRHAICYKSDNGLQCFPLTFKGGMK